MIIMATLTGSISSTLYNNWNLTGIGTKTLIRFGSLGWYENNYPIQPQVTVSNLAEPKGRYFLNPGGSLLIHSYPRYVVNCWVPIPRGANGTAEVQLAEDMRYEVARIIVVQRNSIGDLSPVVPDDLGVPHHELDKEPRCLRYELTLIGAHNKIEA
jgi:hypothetical protein